MEQALVRITEKLQLVLKEHQGMKKELDKLKADHAALLQKMKEQLELNISLEQQLDAAKLSHGITSSGEKKELERKLNQYIREIDRCIALLAE